MLLARFAAVILAVAVIVLGAGVASGQGPSTELRTGYPNKPVRIITGSPGGGNDFASRQIAQGIAGSLHQQVIVENRVPINARESVAKAGPDGYTLLVDSTTLWLTPLLQKTPYDAVRDFSPLTLISRDIFIVVVHPSVPVKSIKELIALAKARPGGLNYASDSVGSSSHLASELFKSMAGVNIVYVPYNGGAPSITALISGQVQVLFAPPGVAAPYAMSGRLRPLAVTSAGPSALAPRLPTVADAGVPGYEAEGRSGIWAPAKTPGAIINRLNQEIVRFLNQPEVKARFLNAGVEIITTTPEQFAAMINREIAAMSKVIKDAGIRVN